MTYLLRPNVSIGSCTFLELIFGINGNIHLWRAFITVIFIFLSELDTYDERVTEVKRLVESLPEPNKRMLEVLCSHLDNVAAKSYKNMMNIPNLGVCFGPTLLRAEEETVAAIMDIKFANVVVEIIVENWRHILLNETRKPPPIHQQPTTPTSPSNTSVMGVASPTDSKSKLTVLPLTPGQMVGKNTSATTSPKRAPPPYPPPPPVIYNNGPKPVRATKSN